MKHLKFIFLSYTFLNICSVFASEDPINHDDLSPKSAELVSEVNTQQVQNNASDVISSNKNKKTNKKSSTTDEFIISSQIKTFDGIFIAIFFSKKVVTNKLITKMVNDFYRGCKNDPGSYDAEIEFDMFFVPRLFNSLNWHLNHVNQITQQEFFKNLDKKGEKYSRRYKNLLRVIERFRKLLSKYPESGFQGIPISDVMDAME